MDTARKVLNYAGSKWRIAKDIISVMPPHEIYMEPYFGSGAVFFGKPPAKQEIINDLDNMVVNLFRMIREYPDELAELVNLTPYARTEFDTYQQPRAGDELNLSGDGLEDARRFLVRCWMSYGGKLADRCGWKTTYHPSAPRVTKRWRDLPDNIIAAAKRLKDAQIECRPAVPLILKVNRPDCHPPYLGTTRGGRMYRVEMMEEPEHIKLLDALKLHTGPAILSGYDNELYNKSLQGWEKVSLRATNSASKPCTECLWINYNVQMRIDRGVT